MEVMLDLETAGTGNDAAITQIGAVMFDHEKVLDKFHFYVDLEDSVRYGGKMDASTVIWWMQQSSEARSRWGQGVLIHQSLCEFAKWLPNEGGVWGNGAEFDNVILRTAYQRSGLICPWDFRRSRCYRTVKEMFPDIPRPSSLIAHLAVDDATSQALHLIGILKYAKAS